MAKKTKDLGAQLYNQAALQKNLKKAQDGFEKFYNDCMSVDEETLSEVLDDAVVVIASDKMKAGSRASLAAFMKALDAKEQMYSVVSFDEECKITLDDIRSIFFLEQLHDAQNIALMKLMTILALGNQVSAKPGDARHDFLKTFVWQHMYSIQAGIHVYLNTMRQPR